MGWSGLLLFEGALSAPASWTFLYGCMAAADHPILEPNPGIASISTEWATTVLQVRLAFDDSVAQVITSALRSGYLDFSSFGSPTIAAVPGVAMADSRRTLQPEPAIARRQVAEGRVYGVPPGYLSAPTSVESFSAAVLWQPSRRDVASLVAEPSAKSPAEPGRALLLHMTEMSGLPFGTSYAERMRCFEIMTGLSQSARAEVRWRALRGTESADAAYGVSLEIDATVPVQVHTVLREEGEVLIDRLDARPAAPTSPIRIETTTPKTETEVRVFDAASGDLIAHQRFLPMLTITTTTGISGGAARLLDDITRRAPRDHRDNMSDATRSATDLFQVHVQPRSAKTHGVARQMRQLAGGEQAAPSHAEWFPRGIGGEIDVIERLRTWAEDPTVEEIRIVDPFMSPATVTRLVRRVRRENVQVTVVSSLTTEDPDCFGEPADAVADLKIALENLQSEIACRLRVVNVVADRGTDATGTYRPGKQAFHDRYVILIEHGGNTRSYVLTNSLNNASGNWPFVLAELPVDVSRRVEAYADGLLRGIDLTASLSLRVDLDWTNTTAGSRARTPDSGVPSRMRFTRDVMRTLAWLSGCADWSGARWPVPRRLRRARLRTRAPLLRAMALGILHRQRGAGIALHDETLATALRRAARHRPPQGPRELAVLLSGLGELSAWSALGSDDVVAALGRGSARRHLRQALAIVAGQVRLERAGSGELVPVGLHDLPLGRELVLRTLATINDPSRFRSPDYGLTGALRAGLGLDATRTVRFLEEKATPFVREIGLHLVYEDLNPFGEQWTFPTLLNARGQSLRMAGVVHAIQRSAAGPSAFDVTKVVAALASAGWDRDDQAWALTVAFCAAMTRLHNLRDGTAAYAAACADAASAASSVASGWPVQPGGSLLDGIVHILDHDGERIMILADAITAAGGDAGGLYRRCLRTFDNAIGLGTTETEDMVLRNRLLDEDRAEPVLHGALPFWAAIAYVRLTGSNRVTRLASRYTPLIATLEPDVTDPLFRAFREVEWGDRVVRLMHVYDLVYRILDEAGRAGLTNGTDWFANDVGPRVDRLLHASEGQAEHLSPQLALLARDRGRLHLSGVAPFTSSPPRLVQSYLDAITAAASDPADFRALESFATAGSRRLVGAGQLMVVSLADVIDYRVRAGQGLHEVDKWWRAHVAQSNIHDLRRWATFVTDWSEHHSTVADPSATPAERELGRRLGYS